MCPGVGSGVGPELTLGRQRIWQTLREKTVSIRGLDGMFSVIEDPTWFVLAPEIFKKARVASVLAVATWYVIIFYRLVRG